MRDGIRGARSRGATVAAESLGFGVRGAGVGIGADSTGANAADTAGRGPSGAVLAGVDGFGGLRGLADGDVAGIVCRGCGTGASIGQGAPGAVATPAGAAAANDPVTICGGRGTVF